MDPWQKFLEWLRSVFGGPKPATPPEPVGNQPEPVNRKVALIIYDPTVPSMGGQKLSQALGWNDPETLVAGYIADLQSCSHGYLNYTILEKTVVDAFPVKKDGFVYDPDAYVQAWQTGTGFHQPDAVDYHRILSDFNLTAKINAQTLDEIWVMAMPYGGFYESIMSGPDAFFCNAPPLSGSGASRKFIIMGFSYQRGVGEMLESFGHRAESILNKVFHGTSGDANLWERFTRYDKAHPGQAECGNVHFAPNSQNDYDWGNVTPVLSRCRNWVNFPNLNGAPVIVDSNEWGAGEIRKHHNWWLSLFPHITGEANGIAYNWWRYIDNPNQVD